jgi:hypothetical protein
MARGKIRIDQIGDYVQDRIEQLMRVTVLETDNRVKMLSPVDLGRFRASWQVGENAAPGGQKPEGTYSSQLPIERLNYSRERIGNIYSVHNNLPYAEQLATGAAGSGRKSETRYNPKRTVTTWGSPGGGSSTQTDGPGWVQGIAKDMQQFVEVNAARIGKTYTRNRS